MPANSGNQDKNRRSAAVERVTKETSVKVKVDLEGGEVNVSTTVGFMDHMLTLLGVHSGMGLDIKAKGDIYIDDHHTVEDVGIALGKAFYDAAGNKMGINRYGQFLLPMDETLVEVALDYSGRSYLHFDVPFIAHKTGSFDLILVEEFFRALVNNAKLTLHITLRHGRNDHHIAEAVFKGVGRALRQALAVNFDSLQSSKGVLE